MIMKKIEVVMVLLLASWSAMGQNDEPIPLVSFPEITVNTTFPQYRAISVDGGVVTIEGGVRGIIIYRENETTYLAFERYCPYQPNQACADVELDLSRIFLIDRCCGSTFNLSDGQPTRGPASWALRQYRVRLNGPVLTITDEIVN